MNFWSKNMFNNYLIFDRKMNKKHMIFQRKIAKFVPQTNLKLSWNWNVETS